MFDIVSAAVGPTRSEPESQKKCRGPAAPCSVPLHKRRPCDSTGGPVYTDIRVLCIRARIESIETSRSVQRGGARVRRPGRRRGLLVGRFLSPLPGICSAGPGDSSENSY